MVRVGGTTANRGGATAYLVGGKMNLRIRLTSAKIKVGVEVEVEAELGNRLSLVWLSSAPAYFHSFISTAIKK